MGHRTKIEWTRGADGNEGSTWTPIRARNKLHGSIGWHCEHVSPGCEHCYAESINKRLGTWLPFKPGHRKDVEIFLDEKMLLKPISWKRPRMIFVCSMTDIFADFVSDEMIDRMFAVMALAPWHIYQVLTKRSKRMREYIALLSEDAAERLGNAAHAMGLDENTESAVVNWVNGFSRWRNMPDDGNPLNGAQPRWPLPNVWLGVSAENQELADERIPDLIETPAAIKFLSLEPLLGPIDFAKVPGFNRINLSLYNWWVIIGGESGHAARKMELRWARDLVAQCRNGRVDCFVKQLGCRADGRRRLQDHPQKSEGRRLAGVARGSAG